MMTEPQGQKAVLDDRILMLFEGNLKRIFALSVTRSTFREIQNVIMNCVEGNQNMANFLFETLMTGEVKEAVKNEKHRDILEGIVKDFTIPARLAKEIYERGEFVNIITSDLVTQNEQQAFLNRVRRIDGEEFVFMADPENTVHLLRHFMGRVVELSESPKGKDILPKFKDDLRTMSEHLKKLAEA